jgi:hypothetical protein
MAHLLSHRCRPLRCNEIYRRRCSRQIKY